ncbi:hypothetical protein BD770DRAFT_438913 [Pilaira anomala]|nr:hypothetical protein BD770DRAFT_438913 [Pilaira anomala]
MGFDIFKKKKAENKLAAAKQRNIIEIPIANPPKKPVTLIDQKPNQPAVAGNTPPVIIMPKPRRAATPTRAILNQFENDKTQVEEDSSVINISPIALPLLIQEQDQVIRKPVPTTKKVVVLQHNNSQSTSSSKTSSKVYESAQEYNSDEDDTRFSNLPSSILLKKKSSDLNNIASDSSSCTVTPRLRPNPVRPSASCTTLNCTRDNVVPVLAAVPTTTASDVDIATAAVAAEYETNCRNPIVINNNTNYREMDDNEMNNEAIAPNHNNSNFHKNDAINNNKSNVSNQRDNTNTDPEAGRINNAHRHDQDHTQRRVTPDPIKDGQDELLNQLKRKVEMMEKQRILDREEWCRKERELLNHRMAMAEHLDETKKQLVDVIKIKEETTKANEAYYQQQLKEHQLNQLQNTVINNHTYSPEQELEDINHDVDVDHHHHHAAETNLADEDTDYQRVVYTEEPEQYERRLPRMRSRGELRYHARSTSRGSHRYSQYYPEEEQERRPASHLSRRNSTASTRLDPSPSATLVSNPMTPRTRVNRTRSKSIESGNWGNSIPKVYEPVDHVQSNRYRVRRSRSVGRRPPSRGPPIVFYADLDDDVDDMIDAGDYPYYDDYRFAHQPHAYYHDEYYMPQQPQQPGPPIQSSYYHYPHQYRQQNYERYGRGRYNY